MKCTPRSDKELAEMNLLPKGTYNFQVIAADEKISKAGAPMLRLNLQILNDHLEPTIKVYDYLLDSMPHKLKHAAYGMGLGNHYEAGNLDPEDFIGKTGQVVLVVQQDKTGNYPDKNAVQDYVLVNSDGAQKLQKATKPYAEKTTPGGQGVEPTFTEDDIPF